MKKRIKTVVFIMVFIMLSATVFCGFTTANNLSETTSSQYTISEDPLSSEASKNIINATVSIDNIIETPSDTTDYFELKKLIQECEKTKADVHTIADFVRTFNYSEDHPLIKIAQFEWKQANEFSKIYKERLKESLQNNRYIEYPYATEIWVYLKEQGYNDYVAAGILGNMMAEVGGQTLNIQYWLYGNGYYGICQWSSGYYQVWGCDLQEQLEFLESTIQYEFNTFGFCYYSGFNYEAFTQLQNASDAALAFAKCYERCCSDYYWIRQENAITAYNYFVNY